MLVTSHVTIEEAEGLAELQMWEDAWAAMEDLSPDERATPAALRVRLQCCPGMGAWDIGEHVAGLLRDGDDLDRRMAAFFYHADARRLIEAGDRIAAAASIKAAVEMWPDSRKAIMLDPLLVAEFF